MELPLSWLAAKRYLLSRKSHSVINLISVISVVAVAVPVAAMIVLLSVSNGFEHFVRNLNRTFDPQIKVTSANSVFFDENSAKIRLQEVEGIRAISGYMESDAMFALDDRQHFGVIRGVDEQYREVFPVDSAVVEGVFDPRRAVLGSGTAYALYFSLSVDDVVTVYVPYGQGQTFFGMNRFLNRDNLSVSGIYYLDEATDARYVIAPLEFVRGLTGKPNEVSALGIRMAEGVAPQEAIVALKRALGPEYEVFDALQQREVEYRIMKNEKKVIFLLLFFVVTISSLTLIGVIVILVLEKRSETATLYTLGASDSFVKGIFIRQGILISMTGIVGGLLLGVLLSLSQQYFGWIGMDGQSMLVDSYPVRLNVADVGLVFFAVSALCLLITVFTVKTVMRNSTQKRN